MDLESSTQSKFSRHLIVHIPNAVFQDNQHVGRFVSFICDSIEVMKVKGKVPDNFPVSFAELESLFVKNDKGDSVIFVDRGTYIFKKSFILFYLSILVGSIIRLFVYFYIFTTHFFSLFFFFFLHFCRCLFKKQKF